MHRTSKTAGLPRREFLKAAGIGAAALALPGHAFCGFSSAFGAPGIETGALAQTHDLPSLSVWGPYSKKYFGISHIPDLRRGLCYDWSIFPMPTKGTVKLPSVMDQSGVHPWESSPRLEHYSLRQELLWKDQLYCDVSFSRLSDRTRLVRMELVNETGEAQELSLNCLSQLAFPPVKELTAEPIRLCAVELPAEAVWVHALDYSDLRFARPRPTDNLGPDGKWRGEERRHDSVGGSVVAENFGKDSGDTLIYRVRPKAGLSDAVLVWRFQMDEGSELSFRMEGEGREITFHGTGGFSTLAMPLGKIGAGERDIRFRSLGGSPIALNGFVLVEAAHAADVRFVPSPWHPVPEVINVPGGLILKYDDVPEYYGFALDRPLAGQKQLKWRELDNAFGTESGPNTKERIFGSRRRGRTGDPDSLFVHTYSAPFTVAPKSRQIIYGLVTTGSEAQVRKAIKEFDPQAAGNEKAYRSAKQTSSRPVSTPAGETFALSQQLMGAVTLSNLVYPVYTQRNYIRHYSPGRSWDCLYTWDAGFIGLGLAELDLQCAGELLNTYTTPLGSQSAFIHHGSPVPVQIYLFHELWNRTQSLELLEYFYPRLQQYHRFLAGRLGSSTTRRHRDPLICTWDYFYNSGGWDDYPPQKYVHQQKLETSAVPVVNSSHAIRCAKILRSAAAALGRESDFAEYDHDIAELSASLQKYSWDEASGYFGYVLHDGEGNPSGILRDEKGVNFNMGLDGVTPLIAGICSPAQENQILDHLFSPQHLWMDIGITTVDQSAPYFLPNGYWNGSVWLAHQWFLWKTMLDLGRGDLALRIARTGLNLWKRVTEDSYDCMEHFMPKEPFGAGWHQFSSLSSPVLPWFASLYTPGRLTCGFDAWIRGCRFTRENRILEAELEMIGKPGGKFSVLACMNPSSRYRAHWNGKAVELINPHDGLLQIELPYEARAGELRVDPV